MSHLNSSGSRAELDGNQLLPAGTVAKDGYLFSWHNRKGVWRVFTQQQEMARFSTVLSFYQKFLCAKPCPVQTASCPWNHGSCSYCCPVVTALKRRPEPFQIPLCPKGRSGTSRGEVSCSQRLSLHSKALFVLCFLVAKATPKPSQTWGFINNQKWKADEKCTKFLTVRRIPFLHGTCETEAYLGTGKEMRVIYSFWINDHVNISHIPCF